MNNIKFKQLLKDNRIYLWEVANKYGCTESTLSKKLRTELSQNTYDKLLKILDELKKK